jgi:hypothetical protein
MSNEVQALLSGGGAPAAKFPTIGTSISGTILSAEVSDQRDIKTGDVKTFDDGNPMKQIIVTLQTQARDDEDDDGKRRLFIKAAMLGAVREAIIDAGAVTLEVGGQLTVTHTDIGTASKKGFSPPKLYTASYSNPDPVASVVGAGAVKTPGYGFDQEPF